MLFKTGEFISEQLADYLSEYTSKEDREDVSKPFGFKKDYYASAIISRSSKVTETNQSLIIELLRRAIHNRTKKEQRLKKVHLKVVKELA